MYEDYDVLRFGNNLWSPFEVENKNLYLLN